MVAQEYLSEYLKERKPGLADFKREIDYFMGLYKKCDEFENEKVFLRWLRLDVRALKQALLNTICKWSNLFKTHLVDHVNSEYVFTVTYILVIIRTLCYVIIRTLYFFLNFILD